MLRTVLLPAIIALFSVVPALAVAQSEIAGRVEFVTGDAKFVDASQQVRRPAPGERLRATDSIVTGNDGEVHLDMEDGGYLAVRPNTWLMVEGYRARGDKDDRAIFKLLRGTFRSFTGWIAKVAPRNYLTRTITATIGVRGTDHEPLFLPEGSDIGEPGTYDKVNEGATFIENASGRIDVLPNTAGFAPLTPGGKIRLLEKIPDFFRTPPNENLLAGRHKLVQERLQERLDARRRLNNSSSRNEEPTREMQEAPADGTPGIQDAPASSLGTGVPGVPAAAIAPVVPAVPAAAVAPGIPAVPASAVVPAVPVISPSAVVPSVPATPTAAAPKVPAASPATTAPGVPSASSAAPASKAPLAAPVAAAPGVPAASPTAVAPGSKEKSSSAVAPSATDRPRSVSGKPRGVPDGGRPAVEQARPAVVPQPDSNDREKLLNERRKKQQKDHQEQYDRERELARQRDLEQERDAEREAIKRSREQR